ncbi:Thyroxine 5-deiodinase [Seminavis robusta]|uniref:Thyroxine 5-deiodinase n=1 Tax=Seminavis robusta TaxID=568900 RepID=A0A9N8DUU8_9STRA|nr:Thyroxine 5-deiodinase [Seminavis robusta]|eukprot:Sro265_g102690.1 Thyroxine 5-deiodinase (129) ;mRNA; f:6676-7062
MFPSVLLGFLVRYSPEWLVWQVSGGSKDVMQAHFERKARLEARPSFVGQEAPEFTLPTLEDDGQQISLSSQKGKPVGLIFGSYSCPLFRAHGHDIEKVHQKYKEQVNFLFVYPSEAHPTEGWVMHQGK